MKQSLADFDNRLINGMDFCKKAYSLFENIRRSPNGVERLRIRKDRLEKKLIEELLPIARYVQARHSHGRQLKVRWKDGTQNYDAQLLSTGLLVELRLVPRVVYLEVTTAVHEKDHIARDIFNKTGRSFTAKGVKKDPQTGKYVSQPYVYTNLELPKDLANRIAKRIQAKTNKEYRIPTILIIQCMLEMNFFEGEWNYAIQTVRDANILHRFEEIFLFDSNHHYSATLPG